MTDQPELSRREILRVAEALAGRKLDERSLRELRLRACRGDEEAADMLRANWLASHRVDVEPTRPEDQENAPERAFVTGLSDSLHMDRDDARLWEDRSLSDLMSMAKVTSIPPVGQIHGRARKQPLYDCVRLAPTAAGSTGYEPAFSNTREYSDGTSKTRADTNMVGMGGCLPANQRAHLFRLGVLCDAGTPMDDAMQIWNRGEVSFMLSQTCLHEWPMRALMPPPREIPTSEIGLIETVYPLDHGASLTVSDQPTVLESLECFRLDVRCPGPIRSTVRLMLIFYAVVQRGIAC